MNFSFLLSKIGSTVRREGISSVLRKAASVITWKQDDFDTRLGTNTSGIGHLWRYSIESAHCGDGVHYAPVPSEAMLKNLKLLSIDSSEFTFIDLGSGKGRALIIARQYGFKRIIGVEFAPELIAIARRNLLKLGMSEIETVLMDAAEYVFPDTPLVVFLYNPFGPTVLRKVLDRLSQIRSPLFIIYYNPTQARLLEEFGFIRIDGEGPQSLWRRRPE